MIKGKFFFTYYFMLSVVMVFGQVQYGREFPAGSTSDNHVSNLTATPLSNGRFVLCWNRTKANDPNYTIIAQIFNNAGEKETDPFVVADESGGSNEAPAVLALDHGGFAVGWFHITSLSTPRISVNVRFFSSSGQKISQVLSVNKITGPETTKLWIAKTDTTTITIYWYADTPGGSGIWGQDLTAEGLVHQSEYQLYWLGRIVYPNVGKLFNGNICICWKENDSAGRKALLSGPRAVINQGFLPYFSFYYILAPQVLPLPGATFIVHWTTFFAGSYGQVFSNDGRGTEKVIHFLSTPEPTHPAFLTYGSAVGSWGFLIYGESFSQSYSNLGILAQFYFSDGTPFGRQFVLPNSEFKSRPNICTLTTGELATAWIGKSDSGNGIFAQIMPSPRRLFTLKPFAILEPENDASLKQKEITMCWQSAKGLATFYPWEELKYKATCSKYPDLSQPIQKYVETDTCTLLTGLEPGQIYFWRVVAFNSSGDSLTSSNTNAFFIRHDATEVADAKIVPASFSLEQNYPNPFNTSTIITFVLPCRGRTTLRIYDLIGRFIAEVFSGYLEIGRHSCVWNGCNANGVTVPSGVYSCSLEHVAANGQRNTCMMKLNLIR